MALINIEYGSIASSDTMNKNFLYLEDKISELSTSTNTMISSILSKSFETKIEDYRIKSRNALNKLSMLPNWNKCFALTDSEQASFKVPKNGYLLLNPKPESKGNLTVNGAVVTLKTRSGSADNAAQLFFIPVKSQDLASSTLDLAGAYFLPCVEISSEEL